jgi:hypothetical protein
MRTTPDASVGMMDAAYFVSKAELLTFFNNTLDLSLSKIEQTCTGAVACQLCEYIFPKSIPLSRIDWGCKASFEYVANYKLLQNAFTKNRVRRHIDVDKLIRGKYQDNLEFCQWLKAWHDQQIPNREGYDPAAVRAKGKGGKSLPPHFRPRGAGGAGKGAARRPPLSSSSSAFSAGTPSRPPSAPPSSTSGPRRSSSIPSSSAAKKRSSGIGGGLPPPAAGRNGMTSTHKENSTPSAVNRLSTPKGSSRPTPNGGKLSAASAAAAAKTEEALVVANNKTTELTNRVAELELLLQKSEEEKEFYFEKLRGVEALVHTNGFRASGVTAEQVVRRIGKVLSVGQGEEIPVDESGAFTGENTEDERNGDAMIDDIAEPSSPYPAASDLLQEVADEGSDDMELMSPRELMA